MLIESYELEINLSPHSAEEIEYEVIAHLPVDIREVLPYLNAVLSRAIYLPDVPALSWRHKGKNIGFWPDRIAVDHLESREKAEETVRWLVDMVNDVWERRHEIEPDHTARRQLQPLELLKLLPRTNCGACGESTCFNFALKLAAGKAELRRCAPLYEQPSYAENRASLEELLATRKPML